MRPWLLLTSFGISFEEVWVSLQDADLTKRLQKYSDSARVPVLIDEDLTVWDSLAICEYINDVYLNGVGLPSGLSLIHI